MKIPTHLVVLNSSFQLKNWTCYKVGETCLLEYRDLEKLSRSKDSDLFHSGIWSGMANYFLAITHACLSILPPDCSKREIWICVLTRWGFFPKGQKQKIFSRKITSNLYKNNLFYVKQWGWVAVIADFDIKNLNLA